MPGHKESGEASLSTVRVHKVKSDAYSQHIKFLAGDDRFLMKSPWATVTGQKDRLTHDRQASIATHGGSDRLCSPRAQG